MSNRLAELEQIHDALGYWDQEDYIEWMELSKAALEAKLEVIMRDADIEYRFWRTYVMEAGNQAHTEMLNCLSRLGAGAPINRESYFINLAAAQQEEQEYE